MNCIAKESDSFVYLCEKRKLCDDLYLAASVSNVKNNKCIVSVLNTSEKHTRFELKPLRLKALYKEFNRVPEVQKSILTVNSRDNHARFERIKEKLNVNDLNFEESKSLLDIVHQYSDIFHIEGDALSSTNAVTHKIPLIENISPINFKQYRLPESQRAEINK